MINDRTILITGVTGNQDGAVAHGLQGTGFYLRGGEEFTLILPDASLTVTLQRAEQLREKFRHLEVMCQNRSLPAETLSLGVAGFPEHGSTVEDILRAADVALYRAKHDGRDRVMVAGTAE